MLFSDLLVTLFGVFTSLATALLLFAVERTLGFSFYSLTFWVIVPFGAFLSGFAAASGYYFGARLFNYKPTKLILFNMLLVSAGTFFLIYYLGYYYMQVDGKFVRDFLPFSDYLSISLRHTSIQFRFHAATLGSTPELGILGFLYAGLQIVGFSVGGLAVYWWLAEQPFCDSCSKYLSKAGLFKRHHGTASDIEQVIPKLKTLLSSDQPEAAIQEHNNSGAEKYVKGNSFRSSVELKACKGCGKSYVKLSVQARKDNNWDEIKDLTTAYNYNRHIHVTTKI